MQKYIKPLNMNGMQGRMLRMPAPKAYSREILLIYGHHASIERMYGIADALNVYGAVTMPDLPGFGGMDSFYSIGMKPTLDNMADYLASFVKLKYRQKKVTIFGMSLGFVIVTRMLQRYPELADKVELLVSVVGFSHKYDITFSRSRALGYRLAATFFSNRFTAQFFYNVLLHPTMIRVAYGETYNARKKLAHLTPEERSAAIEFEVILWRQNDVRTYMQMTRTMLGLNNCEKQILLPLHHISVDTDQYFDHTVVEQHMRVIFSSFTDHTAVMPNHAPSILASREEAEPFIPESVKKLLRRKSQPRKKA
jgi:pimeloyl-ACP methyl ester carboxylesterase